MNYCLSWVWAKWITLLDSHHWFAGQAFSSILWNTMASNLSWIYYHSSQYQRSLKSINRLIVWIMFLVLLIYFYQWLYGFITMFNLLWSNRVNMNKYWTTNIYYFKSLKEYLLKPKVKFYWYAYISIGIGHWKFFYCKN